ncbi:hypothetical protein NDU88_007878 [Pleurodeles waltl]|uniref:Uncharacterized protein n=1 Tax=Pleurodeles waltl TaxID=8319 RepID=A0AAV7QR15_PLEWA|nr:hypothetical protein NDU88_007878 [Pleurodeles waltl]
MARPLQPLPLRAPAVPLLEKASSATRGNSNLSTPTDGRPIVVIILNYAGFKKGVNLECVRHVVWRSPR